MNPNDVKADNNVPFQSNRPRFNIVGVNFSTIVQNMASGNFNAKRATTVAQPDPNLLDPVVSAGQALWDALNNGGIFFLGGKSARPLIIDAIYFNNCTPTLEIVSIDDPAIQAGTAPTKLRDWPATYPVRLGPGECVAVTSTGAGPAQLGMIVKLDGQKIL